MPGPAASILRAVALVLVGAVLAVGCTSDELEPELVTIRQISEDLIRDRVEPQAGLGELTPQCPDVTVAGVGTEYQCTATTADGRVLALDAVINTEGRVELTTTNVITAGALPSFERAAVLALNTETGLGLKDEAIDCGPSTVVLTGEPVMMCAVVDPHTEATFDVTITITDIEARQFSLVVADQPRS